MVFFNWATMQMAAKIVYYGPGLCGKTSNLSYIYAKTSPKSRGEMVSLETESDRTLFFDLLPIEVGTIGGFKTRLQLYTVPGQVFYNTTRQLVLKGVDGLVFVADSQRPMREANIESFKSLMENIQGLGLNVDDLPLVLQFNKRDLDNLLTEEELNADLNPDGTFSWHGASAITGEGVFETLKEITKVTLKKLRKRMAAPQADAAPPLPTPMPPPAKPEPAPGSPSPISASSLARAAEEGAGDGFPDMEDAASQPEAGEFEPPSAIPETEVSDPEPVVEDFPVEPDDDEATVEAQPEDIDEGPSPNEITSPSIEHLPIDQPFGPSPDNEPDAVVLDSPIEEESLEEIEDAEAIEELEAFEDADEAEVVEAGSTDDDSSDEDAVAEDAGTVEEIEAVEDTDSIDAIDDGEDGETLEAETSDEAEDTTVTEQDPEDVEEVVEFDTGIEGMPAIVPPPFKRVQVSDENDILAQLDGLRRHATETAFNRSSGGAAKKDIDLDSLLASGEPQTRDLKRHIEHSLNSNLFEQMGWMQVAFRIQNMDGDTIHTLDAVSVRIQDASDLQRLVLQLTLDLENIQQDPSDK